MLSVCYSYQCPTTHGFARRNSTSSRDHGRGRMMLYQANGLKGRRGDS